MPGNGRRIFFFALMFLLSMPAVTTRLYSSDEIEYFVYLRSVWFDGDLSFDNEYRHFQERGVAQGRYADNFRRTFLEATTATGLRINYAPVGSALLWTPFYIGADLAVRAAAAIGADVDPDGYSRPYVASVTYASALYGFLAIVLSLVAVRRLFGGVDWTFAAVWLGTPLVFYMYVAPAFSHACSAFAVAAFVVTWLSVRDSWSWTGVGALGALAAIMGMVREQDVFIAVGPALDYGVHVVRSGRWSAAALARALSTALVGVTAFLVAFLPQAVAYLVLNGRIGPHQSVERKMEWLAPHAMQVLASPSHGYLFWTPLALPALLGLVLLALGTGGHRRPASVGVTRSRSWIGVICLVMVASQIYVSGSVASWQGGAFGQRRLVGLTIFLVIGLASLFHTVHGTWPRRVLTAVVVLCTWWNLALVAQFGAGLMDRQQLQLGRNAYHAFVTVPRMAPALARRYLFDRASFYQSRTPPAP